MKKNSNKSIPIKVWSCAVLVVIIFFAFFFFNPNIKKECVSYIDLKLDRLESINKSKKNIIAIGTSLMLNGLYFDQDMNILAKQHDINNFNFLKFAVSGRNMSNFDSLFLKLKNFQSDIVFIDASIIFYADFDNFFFCFTNNIRQHIKKNLFGIYSDILKEEKRIQKELNLVNKITLEDYIHNLDTWKTRKLNFTQAFMKFIIYAQQNNITVVILDLLRAKEVQPFHKNFYASYENEIKKVLYDKYGILYKHTSDILTKESFADYSHANFKGRKLMSEDFIQITKEILKVKR